MSRTHYLTLGVDPAATRDAIKTSYYDLRKQFSALRRPTDAQKERLVRINAAWDVLKLVDRRRQYDAELGLDVDAGAEPEADETHRESVRRTAEARKAASEAAAAAAERRAEAAAADRRAKAARAPSSSTSAEPAFEPIARIGLPGGTKWWAMGAGFAVVYVALSAVVHRSPAPAPTPTSLSSFVEEAAPLRRIVAERPAPRHARRRKSPAVHSHRSTQDAADFNRLELERLRHQPPAPAPSAAPAKSDAAAQ